MCDVGGGQGVDVTGRDVTPLLLSASSASLGFWSHMKPKMTSPISNIPIKVFLSILYNYFSFIFFFIKSVLRTEKLNKNLF